MGKLLIDSINLLDRPVIVAYLLVIVTFFIVINLLVDMLYSALDPRVRLTEAERMSDADRRRRVRRSAERAARRSPLRRIASDFLANPIAVFGLALLGDRRWSPRSSRR